MLRSPQQQHQNATAHGSQSDRFRKPHSQDLNMHNNHQQYKVDANKGPYHNMTPQIATLHDKQINNNLQQLSQLRNMNIKEHLSSQMLDQNTIVSNTEKAMNQLSSPGRMVTTSATRHSKQSSFQSLNHNIQRDEMNIQLRSTRHNQQWQQQLQQNQIICQQSPPNINYYSDQALADQHHQQIQDLSLSHPKNVSNIKNYTPNVKLKNEFTWLNQRSPHENGSNVPTQKHFQAQQQVDSNYHTDDTKMKSTKVIQPSQGNHGSLIASNKSIEKIINNSSNSKSRQSNINAQQQQRQQFLGGDIQYEYNQFQKQQQQTMPAGFYNQQNAQMEITIANSTLPYPDYQSASTLIITDKNYYSNPYPTINHNFQSSPPSQASNPNHFLNNSNGSQKMSNAHGLYYQSSKTTSLDKDISIQHNMGQNTSDALSVQNTIVNNSNFQGSQNFDPVFNTIMLIKTLCQTYQKDKIFANSIMKLTTELKDEILSIAKPVAPGLNRQSKEQLTMMIGQIQALEKKKKYYKSMARNLKNELIEVRSQLKHFKEMQSLLKEKDDYISTLRKRMQLIEIDLQRREQQEKNRLAREQSISSNNDFQELVKECDKYMYEHSSDLDTQTFVENEIVKETIEKIKECQEAFDTFKKIFPMEENFKVQNFTQIMRFIQELVGSLSLRHSKIKIREKTTVESTTNNTVSMDSLREMKEKLLKEITDQLDQKVQYRIQQTFDQSSLLSDQNISKSQPIIQMSREEIQKEIMQILQEQQNQQMQNLQTQSSETSQTQRLVKTPSSSQFHKNCYHSNSKNPTNYHSSTKNQGDHKKPSIRPKTSNINQQQSSTSSFHSQINTANNNSQQKRPQQQQHTSTVVNQGKDTKHDSSEISATLQRNKLKGSFILGCDGDAVMLNKATILQRMESPMKSYMNQKDKSHCTSTVKKEKKKLELDEKLNKAEERLRQLEKSNEKPINKSRITEKSRGKQMSEQEKSFDKGPFKSINEQLLEMANNGLGDDEMLLSDQDLIKDKDSEVTQRQTYTFGQKMGSQTYNSNIPDTNFKRTNSLLEQKKQVVAQLKTDSANPNEMDQQSNEVHEELSGSIIEQKQTITHKDQQLKDSNRFGFRNRQTSQTKNKQ